MKKDEWTEYFAKRYQGPELQIQDKPCSDCAVICGMYLEFSEGLKTQTKEIQESVSKRWFCHQYPNKSCRGNIDFLELKKSPQDNQKEYSPYST